MKSTQELEVKPANLWSRIKAQCLNACPYLGENDDGQTVVRCPRCEEWALEREYITLSVAPGAIEWSSPVLKCSKCSHLFSLIR